MLERLQKIVGCKGKNPPEQKYSWGDKSDVLGLNASEQTENGDLHSDAVLGVDVFLEKLSSRYVLNGVVIDQRIGRCS